MRDDPYKEMADTIEERNDKKTQHALLGIGSDLGTINSRMELKLDGFKHAISDYLVSEHLTMDADFFTDVEHDSGGHSQFKGNGIHNHHVITNKELKPLSPGDRVAVLLVKGGQEHVVIAKVVPA